VHLAQDDEEEPALLMAQVCTINTEAEDRSGRVVLDEPRTRVNIGKTEEDQSARVVLDEPRAQVNLGREGEETEELWYLDTGASNHITGNREAFSELDTGVFGTVKFGDNSSVDIRGRGMVVFQCKAARAQGADGCVLHSQAPEQHRQHWPAR